MNGAQSQAPAAPEASPDDEYSPRGEAQVELVIDWRTEGGVAVVAAASPAQITDGMPSRRPGAARRLDQGPGSRWHRHPKQTRYGGTRWRGPKCACLPTRNPAATEQGDHEPAASAPLGERSRRASRTSPADARRVLG